MPVDPGCNWTKFKIYSSPLLLLFMLRGQSCFPAWFTAESMSSLNLTALGNFCFFSEEKKVMACFFKAESSGSVQLKAVTDSQLTVTWWNISAGDSNCFHIHTHSYRHKHNDGVTLENMLMKVAHALVFWLTIIHFKRLNPIRSNSKLIIIGYNHVSSLFQISTKLCCSNKQSTLKK